MNAHTGNTPLLTIIISLCIVAAPARAVEVLVDRCSADIAIVATYSARPDAPHTVVLKRASSIARTWTPPISVQLGDSGHFRWWCHSTVGTDAAATVWNGWTAERSRCANRSNKIRARLGNNSLHELRFMCLNP